MKQVITTSYAASREIFRAACDAQSLPVRSIVHPLAGRYGEELAIDAALMCVDPKAPLMLVSSGCHGVEGHAGSAVQAGMLRDAETVETLRAAGVSVLLLHALNPHGFSWGRRVNEDNVDLNRNFVDFTASLPSNRGYAALRPLLLPRRWPPGNADRLRLLTTIARQGRAKIQSAVSAGQYEDRDGMFFGGIGPTWSNGVLRELLRVNGESRSHIVWIDLHTGLGRYGGAELILAAAGDRSTLERARAWWGPAVNAPSLGGSNSASLTGEMWHALTEECPHAEYTGLVVEFGTLSKLGVLHALRGDHWLSCNPNAPPSMQEHIRTKLLEAFYPADKTWRDGVIEQGLQLIRRTGSALGRESANADKRKPAPLHLTSSAINAYL
jgi:Protein of unknown function (DUF2817)